MLKKPYPLKVIMVAVASLTTVSAMLFSTAILEKASSASLARQIGRTTAVVAHDILDRIDFSIHERFEDIESFSVLAAAQGELNAATGQSLVDQALRSNPGFDGFALYTPQMQLIAAAGDKIGGRVIRPVPTELLAYTPSKGKPLLWLLPPRPDAGSNGASDIQISTSVVDKSGALKAIAVAVLEWDFAQPIFASVKKTYLEDGGADIMLMARGPLVVAVSPDQKSGLDPVATWRAALEGTSRSFVEHGRDGGEFVTGFSRSREGQFGDLELTTFVRQNIEVAHGALFDLQKTILAYALLVTLFAVGLHWGLATVLTSPLLTIAAAADALRQSKAAAIPRLNQFAEVQTLSESLISLVGELNARENSLIELSTSLELQVRDRTQALELQNQRLSVAKQVAEQATEAKNRLLAVASHDLRQPLHALGLFTHTLMRKVHDPEAARLVQRQTQSLAALTRMLDELLHIARIDAGLVERKMVPVHLREVIDRVGAEFSFEADERGLKFNAISADCHVNTDPALLETIVRNLVSNAMKFTARGGMLLAGRRRGPNALIEIYDTGPGIEPSRIALIFREFERSHNEAQGPNKGLGLGLSIVERNAALIGAEIAVHSVVGRGSRFQVVLPHRLARAIAAPAPVPRPPSGSVSGLQILLLDDSTDVLDAFRMDLADRGATIFACTSATEAIALVGSGVLPDIAVVDYDLGSDQTGLDVINAWRRNGVAIPCVILTGRTDGLTLARISQHGIPWIAKPADPDTLADTICQLTHMAASRDNGAPKSNLAVLEPLG